MDKRIAELKGWKPCIAGCYNGWFDGEDCRLNHSPTTNKAQAMGLLIELWESGQYMELDCLNGGKLTLDINDTGFIDKDPLIAICKAWIAWKESNSE